MAVDARWFIIHTYSGYENKVAENIGKIVESRRMHDKIFGVKIPVEKVIEIKKVKYNKGEYPEDLPADARDRFDRERPQYKNVEVEVERKIFPGYVIVKLAVEYSDKEGEENVLKVPDETWHAIRYTSGVTGFVGPDGRPLPLTPDEVTKLGLESDSDVVQTVTEVPYSVGDSVVVTEGTMEGQIGVVQEIDTEAGTVCVSIFFFGRETTVTAPLSGVKLAID